MEDVDGVVVVIMVMDDGYVMVMIIIREMVPHGPPALYAGSSRAELAVSASKPKKGDLYDWYHLKLGSSYVVLTTVDSYLKRVRHQSLFWNMILTVMVQEVDEEDFLVQKFGLVTKLLYCIVPYTLDMPQIRIFAEIPKVKCNISPAKLAHAYNVCPPT